MRPQVSVGNGYIHTSDDLSINCTHARAAWSKSDFNERKRSGAGFLCIVPGIPVTRNMLVRVSWCNFLPAPVVENWRGRADGTLGRVQ